MRDSMKPCENNLQTFVDGGIFPAELNNLTNSHCVNCTPNEVPVHATRQPMLP